MDKRYINFIIITALFFIGYSLLMSKFYPPKKQPISAPTLNNPTTPLPAKPEPTVKETPLKIQEETKEIDMGNSIVTYSLTGGYVKNIHVKKYNEDLIFHDIGYTPKFYNQQFVLSMPQKNTVILENKNHSIKKIWEFKGYYVKLTIIASESPLAIDLFHNTLSPSRLDRRYQEVFYQKTPSSVVKRVSQGKLKLNSNIPAQLVGARDRYFCIVFFQNPYPVTLAQKDKKTNAYVSVNKSKTVWNFYAGPQLRQELAKQKLTHIINYGFFNFIGILILKVLYGLEYVTHSWGLSLILLSVIIYIILFPFTMKSTQAMKKMQQIQPLIQELQTKYKDNPQKLQKEQMMLFKKHKVNPLGGCLPMLFQFPVFIALYQVLFRFIELKGTQFLWIKDLSLPDHTFKLPFSLPYIGNYFNILPLFIIIVSYLQQKITTSGGNAQQQSTAMIFMVLIGVIFYNFPSCLVMYWFIQNILTVLYQYRIHKISQPLV